MSRNKLFSQSATKYGPEYRNHMFEQYMLLIESVEKTSDRRHQANSFIIAINTAIITFIGITTQVTGLSDKLALRLGIPLLGILVNIVFWLLIRSYKQLNAGKFQLIHEIEEKLPLSIYAYEWYVLGEGRDPKKYLPFSHIELFIPWIISGVYLILLLSFLF
jgi:hypothetical protein